VNYISIFTFGEAELKMKKIGDEAVVIRRISLSIQLSLLSLFTLYGQANLRFDNYYIENGLPHSRATIIYQDSIGWIWIGTEGGLARFDGVSFKNYLNGNFPEEEPSSWVFGIWEDPSSRLWISTLDNGLFLYNRSLDRFENFRFSDTCTNCISSNTVYSVAPDTSGNVWIGTTVGLNRYDPSTGSFHCLRKTGGELSSLSCDTIQKVFRDRDNRLWLGTYKGLNYLDPGSCEIVNLPIYVEGREVSQEGFRVEDISQDLNGNILVGTYLNGLFIVEPFTGNSVHIIPDPDYRRSYTVRTVLQEENGNLWLGTRGGIYVLGPDYRVIAHYVNSLRDQGSLGHNSVSDIFKDRAGDIWVTSRSGLSHLNLRSMAFQFYRASAGDNQYLNDPEVYAICQSREGNIWLGTESGGVNILDLKSGGFSYLTHDEYNRNSLSSNCIKTIIQDSRQNYWIGTFLGGLDHYDVKKNRFTNHLHDPLDDNSLSSDIIWSLHEDRNGNLWIGTDEGLDRFDPVKEVFYHYRTGAENQPVHAISEDRAGNLFFGSNSGNLIVMKPDSTRIEYDFAARVVFEDSQGRIWIGADGDNGLMRFEIQDGVVQFYQIQDGLPSNQVYGILEDDSRNLWISTGRGLSKFDPDNEVFTNYKAEDGIQGDRFYYGSYCRGQSGELYFGGQHGLTVFRPDQLRENSFIPPVVITDFKLFNRSVPIGGTVNGKRILEKSISESEQVVVHYDQSVLTIDYVALNYLNSSKNEYAYMLEGFEKDWNYVGSNRSATYTNLDPGSYIFRVKGSNNNDLWNETGAAITLIITPPFSKTLFFKIIMVMLTIMIVYLIVLFFIKREKLRNELVIERVKFKELHKIDMLKFQFFTNISHEIRTPIALIVSPLTRIKNSVMSREQIMMDLEVVYRNALRLGKLVDQLLDYRKLEAGKLKLELSRGNIVSFLENILFMFKEMSADKKIDLKFYSAMDQADIYFDADKIEKVVFNLLSNAFKHTSEEGTISVVISTTYITEQELDNDDSGGSGEYVQIVVRDTGTGIEDSKKEQIFDRFYQAKNSTTYGSGIGLALSRELIKIHHGRISLKSQMGVGTEITIRFPVVKEDPKLKEPSEATNNRPLVGQNNAIDKESLEKLAHIEDPVLLVLEDNRELLEFIASIFREEYYVLTAEDGEAGLELAREAIPDLVISDILMPRLDGIKLCKKLKQDFRTSHIPVILLTALSTKQHEKEGILGGADEYIAKPFDPSLLKIKVDQLLATRRLLKEKYTRDYILEPRLVPEAAGTPDDKFLAKLVSIVEDNISDPEFGTLKISREIGVSRTQLYRKISALTEMTVKEFIRNIRLKRAAQLIKRNGVNISEVAYAVGFQQVAYFRKCFKEMYGMTPSEFAKSK
jgi:signal transduction histidine kinase/ligand-binding sensor domain-containing protein/AraC-like DNA-binding protein/ActR/RegA family two-component response regulator